MSLSKKWNLQIDSSVLKVLKNIPRQYANRILEVIRFLSFDPYFGDIKKMKGEEDVWRRRIGEYRLFYKIQSTEQVILVFRVERRTSSTY